MAIGSLANSLLLAAGIWASSGLPGAPDQVLFDPADASHAYATTVAGLYRSSDGGRTWQLASMSDGFFGFVVAPSDSSVLYAFGSGGVVRSPDRGDSWSVGTPPPVYLPRELTVDPRDPNTVYAAGAVSSFVPAPVVVRSTDGGRSWTQSFVVADRTNPPLLAAGPPDPGAVLAVLPVGVPSVTLDGGGSWRTFAPMFPPGSDTISALASDQAPGDPDFYALGAHGVYRTRDFGASWTLQGTSPPGLIARLAVRAGVLFVATSAGVFRSMDAAATWLSVVADRAVWVAVAALDPTIVLAAAGIDAWRSADGGRTFTPDGANFSNGFTRRLFIDGRDRAFGLDLPTIGGTVYERLDSGGWTRFSTAPVSVVFELDPNDPATQYRAPIPALEACPALEKTKDAGVHWSPIGLSGCRVAAIGVDPFDARHVIVEREGGIFVSLDGGGTFALSLSLPEIPVLSASIAFDPRRVGRVYAGPWTSSDGGATWTTASESPCTGIVFCSVGSIAVDPLTGTVYETYFGSGTVGLFRSRDSGSSWESVAAADALNVRDVAVDPTSGDLYVATVSGVSWSRDGGDHFESVDAAHLQSQVSSVRVRRDGSVLAASGTVFELPGNPPRESPVLRSPRRSRNGSRAVDSRARIER